MMMQTRIWSKMWFFGLIVSFFIFNWIFWRYRPHGGCDQSGNCTFFGKVSSAKMISTPCIDSSYIRHTPATLQNQHHLLLHHLPHHQLKPSSIQSLYKKYNPSSVLIHISQVSNPTCIMPCLICYI